MLNSISATNNNLKFQAAPQGKQRKEIPPDRTQTVSTIDWNASKRGETPLVITQHQVFKYAGEVVTARPLDMKAATPEDKKTLDDANWHVKPTKFDSVYIVRTNPEMCVNQRDIANKVFKDASITEEQYQQALDIIS